MGNFHFAAAGLPGPIDIETIIQWIDTGSLIALAVVLGFLLLAFLRGLIRGWRLGTYRLILIAAFVAVGFCLLPVLTQALGNLDLRGFGVPESFTFSINDQPVTIPVTTAFETVYETVVVILRDGFRLNVPTDALANYAVALTISILRLVLIFVIVLLAETVWAFLIWLLWHILFKHFIPKERRRPKLRFLSGLEEALTWFALTALTIIPFSGIVNALRNNATVPEDTGNETISMVNRVLDTYENSIFNQVFFAWTRGSGRDSIDTQLAEFFAEASFTTASGETYTANIVRELRVLAALEGSVVDWIYAEDPSDSTAGAMIHTALLMGQSLYNIAVSYDDSFLNSVVPLTLDIAGNADDIAESLGETAFETAAQPASNAKRKWAKRAYNAVAETGYVSAVEDALLGDYPVPLYDGVSMSEGALRELDSEMSAKPARRKLVNSIVSGYVQQAKENPIPTDSPLSLEALAANLSEEQIDAIDWYGEASKLQNVRNRLAPRNEDSGSSPFPIDTDGLILDFRKALARDAVGLAEILVGKRDASGEPGADDRGASTGERPCLLDSDLVMAVLPAGLEIGSTYLSDMIFQDDASENEAFASGFNDVVNSLVDEKIAKTRVNFRREFGAILDVAIKIADTEIGKQYILDYENTPGLTFAADGTLIQADAAIIEAINGGVRSLDRAKTLTYALPKVANHFIEPLLEEDGALADLGIQRVNIPENGTLGNEIAKLLEIGIYCNDLVPILGPLARSETDGTSLSLMNMLNAIFELESDANHHQITHLLDIALGSKILNPDNPETGAKNENIAALLNTVFSNLGDNFHIEFAEDELDGYTLVSQWEGDAIKPGTEGEAYYLVNALKAAFDGGMVDTLLNMGDSGDVLSLLSGIDIEPIFAGFGASAVMRDKAPAILDPLVLKMLAEDYGDIGMTYANLDTAEKWAAEGAAMQNLIDLATRGIDLSDFDIFDPVTMDLLETLASSGVFQMPDGEYVFSRFLTDKLLTALDSPEMLSLLADYPEKVPEGETKTVKQLIDEMGSWTDKDAMKRKVATTFLNSAATLDSRDAWIGYEEGGKHIDGEIDHLRDVLGAFKAAGGFDGFDLSKDTIPSIRVALHNLGKSRLLGPTMAAGALNKALDSAEIADLLGDDSDPDAVPVNIGWLYRNGELQVEAFQNHDEALVQQLINARVKEFDCLIGLISSAFNSGLLDGGSMSIDFGTLDPEFFLRPFLSSANDSKLLNPTEPEDFYSADEYKPNGFTKFEFVVSTFLAKSGAFTDHSGHAISEMNVPLQMSSKTLRDVVNDLPSVTNWDTEIDAICEMVRALQDSGFIKDGQLDLSAMSDIDQFFADPSSVARVTNFLSAANQSECFYRVIAPKFDELIGDGLGLSDAIPFLDEDLRCADFFYTYHQESLAEYDYEPYDDGELPMLIESLRLLSSCAGVDTTNISSIDAGALGEAFTALAKTHIFNYNTAKSASVFASTTQPYRAGLTSLQALCCDIIDAEAVQGKYYVSASPKDIAHAGDYNDAKSKFAYMVREYVPANPSSAPASAAMQAAWEEAFINEWAVTLKTMQHPAFAAFAEGAANPLQGLQQQDIADLLRCLNDCRFYMDCVPNAIYDAIVNDPSINIQDIDLGAADVYFSYYCHDGDGHFAPNRIATPDFNMPFYDGEIDQIAMLFTLLSENKDVLAHISPAAIDTVMLRNMLLDLSDSYMFHEAAKQNDALRAQGVSASGGDVTFLDLTVFEQFIYKFLVESGLSDQSFRGLADAEFALNGDGTKNPNGAKYKTHAVVRGYTETHTGWLTEIQMLTTDGLPHDGDDEMNTVGVVEAGKKSGIFDDAGEITVEYDVLKKVSPKQVKMLLQSVSRSALLGDVLPYNIAEMFGAQGIGLSAYSTKNFEYDGHVGATVLSIKDFAGAYTDYTDPSDPGTFRGLDTLSFASSSNPSGHFSVVLDADGTEITSLVECTYEDGVATFDFAGLSEPFTMVLNGPAYAPLGTVTLCADLGDFRLSGEQYRAEAIPSLGHMLSSAYRGNPDPVVTNQYFSFDSGSNLSDFLDDPQIDPAKASLGMAHSTYGIFDLFAHSGFYDTYMDINGDFVSDESESAYQANGYALYKALKFDIEAPIDIDLNFSIGTTPYSIPFPAQASVALGAQIGDVSTEAEHMGAITDYLAAMSFEDLVREARWFDVYSAKAGTLDLYNYYQGLALSNQVGSIAIPNVPAVHDYIFRAIDKIFAISGSTPGAPDAIESIMDAYHSYEYDYQILVADGIEEYVIYSGDDVASVLGGDILAGLTETAAANKAGHIGMDYGGYVTSGTPPFAIESKRITRLPNMPATYIDDVYGNPSKGYFDNAALSFAALRELCQSTVDLDALADCFEGLDGDAVNFSTLFYVSGLYDTWLDTTYRMLYGIFGPTAFPGQVRTDFASFLPNSCYEPDPSNPTSSHAISFSFAALAENLRALA